MKAATSSRFHSGIRYASSHRSRSLVSMSISRRSRRIERVLSVEEAEVKVLVDLLQLRVCMPKLGVNGRDDLVGSVKGSPLVLAGLDSPQFHTSKVHQSVHGRKRDDLLILVEEVAGRNECVLLVQTFTDDSGNWGRRHLAVCS